MIRIGILGDIGAGKSYIAKKFGFPVFNADEEVKKLYKKNKKIFIRLNKIIPKHIQTFPIQKKEIINAILKDENNLPKKISFLRLDTDLYSLTKFQLEILFPRLVKGGVLHIDDYGMFPGVQNAIDEYFEGKKIWLPRVDFTTRMLIKE